MSHVDEVVTLLNLMGLRVYTLSYGDGANDDIRIKRGTREGEPHLFPSRGSWFRGPSGQLKHYRLIGYTPQVIRLLTALDVALLDVMKEGSL
jgi:hypothetical protein